MGCLCSSEKDAPMNPTRVDQSHFTMMKVVGKGGFGKVNAVTHRTTNVLMAMKRMKKSKLITKKMYVVTAWRERDVMAQLKSPFLVNLLFAFQDETDLFLIMPFMQGGDLRYFLTQKGRMLEEACRFYAAEVIMGLEELHSLNVVYRDLKPDNLLLDSEGHLRISDFGLAVILKKENDYKVSGGAGTPGYQAPEVLKRLKYGISADYWSLGITLYECLERQRPFHSDEEVLSFQKVAFHHKVSPEAKSLIRGLLSSDPEKRLGCTAGGIDEIKKHPFFKDIDWTAVHDRKLQPPFQPDLDRANCLADHELQDQFFAEKKEPPLTAEQQKAFEGYEFNTEYNGNNNTATSAPHKNHSVTASMNGSENGSQNTKPSDSQEAKASSSEPKSSTYVPEDREKDVVDDTD